MQLLNCTVAFTLRIYFLIKCHKKEKLLLTFIIGCVIINAYTYRDEYPLNKIPKGAPL